MVRPAVSPGAGPDESDPRTVASASTGRQRHTEARHGQVQDGRHRRAAKSPTPTRRRSSRSRSRSSSAVCGRDPARTRPSPTVRRAAIHRTSREMIAARRAGRGRLHTAPRARRRPRAGARGRRARARGEAARVVARRLRRDARRGARGAAQAGHDQPAAVVSAGAARQRSHRRRQDRPPDPGHRHHAGLARRGVLPQRPLARQLGRRGRRRAGQPGAAPAGPAAVVHGRGRGAVRLLGQPEPPVHRGRGHGRRGACASAAARSATSWSATRRTRAVRQGPGARPNGASVGVQTDGGAMFIAGMSTGAEPPVNDLWTVPGEEQTAGALEARGPRALRQDRRRRSTIISCRSRTSCARSSKSAPRWSPARRGAGRSRSSSRSTVPSASAGPCASRSPERTVRTASSGPVRPYRRCGGWRSWSVPGGPPRRPASPEPAGSWPEAAPATSWPSAARSDSAMTTGWPA